MLRLVAYILGCEHIAVRGAPVIVPKKEFSIWCRKGKKACRSPVKIGDALWCPTVLCDDTDEDKVVVANISNSQRTDSLSPSFSG